MEKEPPVKKQVVPPEILALFPGTYIKEEDESEE
jgi:hypothetical protein